MTERAPTDNHSTLGGWHLQISKLLVVAVIVATAATGALIVTVLTQMPSGQTPPPPPPGGLPPPPPNLRPLAVVSIVTGFFVLSWLAVLVVVARDQVLRELRQRSAPTGDDFTAALADFRAELAGDRERELQGLTERMAEVIAEYGETRETDGYLSGMRTATTGEPPAPNVRSLRPKR